MGYVRLTGGSLIMKKVELYGETYYQTEEIREFIRLCKQNNKIIWGIDFYKIIDGKVIPYENFQGIDSTNLYDKKQSHKENLNKCNSFINDCINKYFKNLVGLYFNAIVEE